MKNVVQEYRNATIVVRFDPRICIHAGNCVRGLRPVFDVQKRPWINVEAADADAIVAQIEHCPSGALTFERLQG